MNKQDLLFTNRFQGITEVDFKKFLTTNDRSNFLKTKDRPFPKRLNRNNEPIISNTVRDIVKERYKKRRTQLVLIDSRDRDRRLYPKPNAFRVGFGHEFTFIDRVSVKCISFDQPFPTVSKTITWTLDGQTYSATIPFGKYNFRQLQTAVENAMNAVAGFPNYFTITINKQTDEVHITARTNVNNIVGLRSVAGTSLSIIVDGTLTPGEPFIITGIPTTTSAQFEINNREFASVAPTPIIIGGNAYNEYVLTGQIPFITEEYIYAPAILPTPASPTVIVEPLNPLPKAGTPRIFGLDFNNSSLLRDVFNWYECSNENFLILEKAIFSSHAPENVGSGCINWICWCDEHIILPNPYYLLRLMIPFRAPDSLGGAIIKTQDSNLQEFKSNHLIAKFLPPVVDTVPIEYLTTSLDNFSDIIVNVLDNFGNVIDTMCDYTITLEITETIDVLKDTLISSKYGEANDVGIKAL